MKELITEWRKFLKEQEAVDLPDEAGSTRTTLTPEQQKEEYKKQQEQKFINDFYRAREEYWKKNSPQGQEAWNADPVVHASAPLTSQQQQLFKLYDKLQSSKTEIDREYFIKQINNLQYGVNPIELWDLFNGLAGGFTGTSITGQKISGPRAVKKAGQGALGAWPGVVGVSGPPEVKRNNPRGPNYERNKAKEEEKKAAIAARNAAKGAKLQGYFSTHEKEKSAGEKFKHHLELGNEVANSPREELMNAGTRTRAKFRSVVQAHTMDNLTFPTRLAEKLLGIAKTGRSQYIKFYQGRAYKGVDLNFARRLVGDSAILPDTAGTHRIKLRAPVYLDPATNLARTYLNRSGQVAKPIVSEWTTDLGEARAYSKEPASADVRTRMREEPMQKVVILVAEASPGKANFIDYRAIKEEMGLTLFNPDEILSIGRVPITEIIVYNTTTPKAYPRLP